eukprot:scaffold7808_cov184-Amphora_coffeaeformis.AAC.5
MGIPYNLGHCMDEGHSIARHTEHTQIMRALPPPFSKAVETIHWSFDTPPLYYQSLEELQQIRVKDKSNSNIHHPLFELLSENTNANDKNDKSVIQDTLDTLFGSISTTTDNQKKDNNDDEQVYFGWISLALVLLGHGWTDECHNLVTPLSWPDDISFAHGPSRYATGTYSCFRRSHRQEAFHVGELGMVGFQNANYWGNCYTRTAAVDHFPHDQLCEAVVQLAQCPPYAHSPPVKEWLQAHGFDDEDNIHNMLYDPRAVHALCATVLRQSGGKDDAHHVVVLRQFAEQVATRELQILLQHTLAKAGYEMPSNVLTGHDDNHATNMDTTATAARPSPSLLDADVAMRAARKISSAHMERFQTQGSIVLRRMKSSNEGAARAVAAGVACRLLATPACRQVVDAKSGQLEDNDNILEVLVATQDLALEAGAHDLQAGDVWAQCDDDDKSRSSSNTDNGHPGTKFRFMATTADDPAADYVDPLFGMRGETPTTVVQWSKGTIF